MSTSPPPDRVRCWSGTWYVVAGYGGKTTAIRMLCGLLKPTFGRGTCLGYDPLARLFSRAMLFPPVTASCGLQGAAGVEQVTAFGRTLHVSGTDSAAPDRSVAPLRDGYEWNRIEPGLEDVFIHLMERRQDPGP